VAFASCAAHGRAGAVSSLPLVVGFNSGAPRRCWRLADLNYWYVAAIRQQKNVEDSAIRRVAFDAARSSIACLSSTCVTASAFQHFTMFVLSLRRLASLASVRVMQVVCASQPII
jgi:hypothetical protein